MKKSRTDAHAKLSEPKHVIEFNCGANAMWKRIIIVTLNLYFALFSFRILMQRLSLNSF